MAKACAYGLIWPGESDIYSSVTAGVDVQGIVNQYGVRVVPLVAETAKVKHADKLYEVLKDLTGLAKMASAPLNTYQAAVRNAVELLNKIERESMEDVNHV